MQRDKTTLDINKLKKNTEETIAIVKKRRKQGWERREYGSWPDFLNGTTPAFAFLTKETTKTLYALYHTRSVSNFDYTSDKFYQND